MCVRDDDIPVFVSDGVCEFGIVGLNVLEEFALGRPDARFEIIARLGFGRCGLRLAASDRLAYGGPQSLAGARIATSYPPICKDRKRARLGRGVSGSVYLGGPLIIKKKK